MTPEQIERLREWHKSLFKINIYHTKRKVDIFTAKYRGQLFYEILNSISDMLGISIKFSDNMCNLFVNGELISSAGGINDI